jgi:hypothetical protein
MELSFLPATGYKNDDSKHIYLCHAYYFEPFSTVYITHPF